MVKKKKIAGHFLGSFKTAVLAFLLMFLLTFLISSKAVILFDKFSEKKLIPSPTKITPKTSSPNPSPSQTKPQEQHKTILPQNYGRSINVPILTYHYIGTNGDRNDTARDNLSVAPDKFEEQMQYLATKGYTPITLDTMYAGLKGQITLPSKPVILTFDDGYIDFYVNAYPILRRFGFHAVSFIPTGLMNQGYYLTWTQIEEMNGSGLISFEAHSVNHPNLTTLPYDSLKYQLSESKKVLESHTGRPVNFFAYPYGASNEVVWQAVKDAGFVGAVGTWGGAVISEGNIIDMPRIKIPGGLPISDFAGRL